MLTNVFFGVICALVTLGIASPISMNVATKHPGAALNNVDPSWYCDDSGNYCDGGGACCPVLGGSGFKCAPNDDSYATCSIDGLTSCPSSKPQICGDDCCSAGDVCRDEQCYSRTAAEVSGAKVQNAAGFRPGTSLAWTRSAGPSKERLGWWPSSWADGMLKTVTTRLHQEFLAVQADAWRSTENKPGNCWIIGFPSDLSNCDINKPWEDGCKGSSATITQDGTYTFYNNNPTFTPTNYDRVDWCNDAYNATQVYTHAYEVTQTATSSFTLTEGIKATVGMESTTKVGFDIGVGSGSEAFKMSASVETDFSSSQTQTSSTSKTWKQSNQVNVSPRTRVASTCFLQVGTFNSPFDGRVKINSPVTWACSSPAVGRDQWIFATDPSYRTSQGIETFMEDSFGFAKEDLQGVFGQKIGGTFTGIAGQKTQCSTHVEKLKDGESCPIFHESFVV